MFSSVGFTIKGFWK